PQRVGRLLLVSPAGLSVGLLSPEPTEGIRRFVDFATAAEPTRDLMRAFLTTLVHDPAVVTDELVEERFARAMDPEARLGGARVGAALARPDLQQDMMLWREAARVDRPTLLVWGREDRVTPLDGALFALRSVPDARLHVLPHCGHWVLAEASAELHRLAADFFTDPSGS
ncbi:alpha/beta fold hydrolase, partial [Streptomyces sp. NPDC054841]